MVSANTDTRGSLSTVGMRQISEGGDPVENRKDSDGMAANAVDDMSGGQPVGDAYTTGSSGASALMPHKRSQINWTVAAVDHFAHRYGMSPASAFVFLDEHGGIAFLKEFYDVEHTLSFDNVAEDLLAVCRQSGGDLI